MKVKISFLNICRLIVIINVVDYGRASPISRPSDTTYRGTYKGE